MRHEQPSQGIDGCYPRILVVRDLTSWMQPAWRAVADATATEALSILEGWYGSTVCR